MDRIFASRSLFWIIALAYSLGSAACKSELAAESTESAKGTSIVTPDYDRTAPQPAPVPLKCILPSPHGSRDGVTTSQCKELLKIAGCSKPGAVVNDTMKCSTTA